MRPIHFSRAPHRYSTLNEFLKRESSPSGNYEILNGLPLHVFWEDKKSDTTFVSFGGTVNTKVQHLPAYSGFGVTRNLNANIMLISDPTLILSKELRLAWYAGNLLQQSLQKDLTEVITSLAKGTRVVLFGPSGGGFAALEQATRIPRSTVVVSNPQTDINRFMPIAVEKYMWTAWGTREINASEQLFTSSVISKYKDPRETSIVYIQNIEDHAHVHKHWRPLIEAMDPVNRILSLTPKLGEGHIGPDAQSFVKIFNEVCNTQDWSLLKTKLQRIDIQSSGKTN